MDETANSIRFPSRPWVAAAAAGVLLWRAAAYMSPSSFITISDGVRLPMLLLGLVFLIAGLWTWLARPDRWTRLFLLFGLCGGIHWGGAVGATSPTLALSLFFVYLAASALGNAALLHLSLVYARRTFLAKAWRVVLYAPAVVALLCSMLTGRLPQTVLEPLAGVLHLAGSLFSLLAGLVFLIRLVTADPRVRSAARLPLIVAGAVVATVVAQLGSSGALPGPPDVWNLAFGIIPISLAVALVSQRLDE